MTDVVGPDKRSDIMSKIQGKDTSPELKIRKALFHRGYRYRLHDKELPGKPDIKLTKYNAVIEIQGCFWHGHDCHLFKKPDTNTAFWENKITSNIERDQKNKEKLLNLGWRLLVIWECALKGKFSFDLDNIIDKTEYWLKSDIQYKSIQGRSR